MTSNASNAEFVLHGIDDFDDAKPLSQGRRLTLIRRSHNAKRVLLLVHGLKSSAETWIPFVRAAYDCPTLQGFDFAAFEYQTAFLGRLRFPFRKVDAEDWSRVLADTLQHSLIEQGGYEQVVMVGHSMGGIVCKMVIRDLASEGKAGVVKKIHSVFTYATPHFGSDRAFLPAAVLSYDVSFLRTNSKALQGLQRFWNTRVGMDKDFNVHERAIVSASDEVVPMISSSGGLSQNYIFHVATSHTKVHCPDDAKDRRITWLCQEIDRIDRRSTTELIDIHNLPSPSSYNAENVDFLAELFKMTFVLGVGSADGVAPGDQFQLFYEPEQPIDGGNIVASPSASQWNLLEASRVEEHRSYATMINFSGDIALRRLEQNEQTLGISPTSTPSAKQISELVHGMFDHAATRIPRAETRVARHVLRAIERVQREKPGSSAWRRATHDVLEYAEQFLAEYPESPLAEGIQFDRAFALKSVGRLEEARSRFERFVQMFPFSVSMPGARQYLDEIEYRLAANDDPDDLYKVLRLGTYLMGYGDFAEGVHIVRQKLLTHPNELGNFKPNTRLDLFASLVASELLGERFVDRSDFADWLRGYRNDLPLQQQAESHIQKCEEPDRSLLLVLHAGLLDDIDAMISEA